MLNILYAEVNFVGAMVLLLMLTSQNKNSLRSLPVDQQIFNGVMFFNLLIFLFDTGMWLANGAPGPVLKLVNYTATTLYYLFNPLICVLWLMYADIKINESKSGLRKRARLYVLPAAVCAVITLASPFTGCFFVIDGGNRYARGPLFPVMAAISISYLLCSCVMVLMDIRKTGWEQNKSINLPLIILPVSVTAASMIQIRFFGLSIIWVCAMLACASIYINLQNTEVSTDHLTGLYNRRRLDQHLQRRIQMRRAGRLLFAVILDLDEFKQINDRYGHMVGDTALIRAAELLRQSCKSEDFIARMGGDEFIIIGERADTGEIEELMHKLKSDTADYNGQNRSEYILSFSMGYSVFKETDTEDSFLAATDQAMYLCKQNRKTAAVQAAL